MTAPKKPKAARNMATTETVNARIRNRPRWTIGSATRDSDPQEDAAAGRAPRSDQPADVRIGPVAGLLVGQADQERPDRRREDRRAEVVDVAAGLRALDRRQQPPAGSTSETSADRHVDEEDPVPAERGR